jgi:hypothetical protein
MFVAQVGDDEARQMLIELFENMPTSHGQYFDNGKRWCAICESSQIVRKATEHNKFADKICCNCNCIWPEYQDMLGMFDAEDFCDEQMLDFFTIH